MLFYLRPFIFSLLFLGLLEFSILRPQNSLGIYVLLVFLAVWGARKIGGRWIFVILPILFTQSSLGMLFLVDGFYQQQVFALVGFLFFYLILLSTLRLHRAPGDLTARGMNMAASAATTFFAYSFTYGIYLNFLVPLWSLMATYFLITFLASYQFFVLIESQKKQTRLLYSGVLALSLTEIAWTMNFWPFGYLTTGVIVLILYYVLWDLAHIHFTNKLSKSRVTANLIFFGAVISVVLLSAKWLPVI